MLAKSISCKRQRGFSLTESLVALTILAMASAVILLAVETSVSTTYDSVESTIAEGMAQQLIDEVLATRYKAPSADPYQFPLVASGWELAGNGRERFNDTDDFNGFVAHSAEDKWGRPLGQGNGHGGLRHEAFRARPGYFHGWLQKIEVYYVDNDDPSTRLRGSATSNYRAVEVTISRKNPDDSIRTLANLRRVFAYVPPPEDTW